GRRRAPQRLRAGRWRAHRRVVLQPAAWSPEFANLNVALDYFEIQVNDQIARIGASSIVAGCYNSENFPNAFCDLLVRAPNDDATVPNNITNIDDSFVNINEQTVRGLDLNVTWAHNFDWGRLNLEAQSTYQFENEFQLFDPSQEAGFNELDVVGDIGTPELVSNLRATFTRNDWSVTYALQYASETDDSRVQNEQTTYFGQDPAFRDLTVDDWWSHSLSFLYRQDNWDFLIGIDNVLDQDPDLVSFDVATVRGTVPIAASQQSLLGRTFFGRIAYRF
ncbi:MAG: TonB-dependent receptor, partial [Pseudomonadota bacterium]